MDMEEELDKLLINEILDLKLLLQRSREKGGFRNNNLRRKLWPKLLGINKYNQTGIKFTNGIEHRDKQQCVCDVERSFQNIIVFKNQPLSIDVVQNRRVVLDRIIMTLLVNHPNLYYYQGLNDIFSVIILIMEDEQLSYLICEQIAVKYLYDFMQTDFKNVAHLIGLSFKIVQGVDPKLYAFLIKCGVQPFFATSWVVTWFSHDIKELHKVARVFDMMLTSIPLFSIYISAAIMIYFKNGILKQHAEIAYVHSYLANLVKKVSFPLEEILAMADKLLEQYPPVQLAQEGYSKMNPLFKNAKVQLLELNKPIPRYIRADWKLLSLQRIASSPYLQPNQSEDKETKAEMFLLHIYLIGDSNKNAAASIYSGLRKYSILIQASATLIGIVAVFLTSKSGIFN